jgi:hypothetical protein
VDNVESRVERLEGKMERILKILDDNGQPGLVSKFNRHQNAFERFMAVWEAREHDKCLFDDRQERERIEESKSFHSRMNILIGLAGLILAMVTCVVCVLSYERAVGHAIMFPTHNSDMYNAEVFENYNSSYPTGVR